MSRIVHLSDLHLGKAEDWQKLTDDKSGLLGGRGITTQDVLRDTFRAFATSEAAKSTAAVAISGDLTNRAREDGYRELDALLQPLPAALTPDKVVVVPGNHDVAWDAPAGSPERYRHWRTYVRERGFVTPLLHGTDFDDAGELLPDDGHRRPILEGDDFVMFALNSSDYCGVVEGAQTIDWDAALRFKVRNRAATRTAVKALRQHDLARISSEQIRALRTHTENEHPALLNPAEDQRVRIAVLHHHLLPVSTDEEIKTFESVVDLGITRLFLRDLGFHMVLHGHKHRPNTYFDYPADPQHPLGPGQRRILVLAAPGNFRHGELAFRLLDLRPRGDNPRGARAQRGTAPNLDVRGVSGLRSSEDFHCEGPTAIDLWRADMETSASPFTAIYGETREEVYERLQSRFEAVPAGTEIPNLLCVVRSSADEDQNTVPSGYPAVAEDDENAWFTSLVDWWQAAESNVLGQSKATAFNHGQRIHGRRWGDEFDAVERAANVLFEEPDTTRSIAVLVDPRDEAGHLDREFPAFVLAQLRLVTENGDPRLDCLGYFRKQDVRHWWPVNVAELARMQKRALLWLSERGIGAKRGHVITFAAAALVDERLPSLDIARIDRALDEEEEKRQLWRMAYAVFHPTAPSSAQAKDLWDLMLSDLGPPAGGTGTKRKIATVGLDELYRRLDEIRAVNSGNGVEEIVQFVKQVRDDFRDLDDAVTDEPYMRAANRLDENLPKLQEAVAQRLSNVSGVDVRQA